MICKVCQKEKPVISKILEVCSECIRNFPEKTKPFIEKAHQESRKPFNLPPFPPSAKEGIKCKICANECKIPENELGFCGLRKNIKGSLLGPTYKEAKVSWYLDPLPTNCVADWVCPAGTGCGYPEYAYKPGAEHGYYNLAVFFHACSLNCLFCQNWHFRELTLKPETRSIEEFLSTLTSKVSCICYFGGDPSPQLPFAIKALEKALKNKKKQNP